MCSVLILYLICGLLYTCRDVEQNNVFDGTEKWYLVIIIYIVGSIIGFPIWVTKKWKGVE